MPQRGPGVSPYSCSEACAIDASRCVQLWATDLRMPIISDCKFTRDFTGFACLSRALTTVALCQLPTSAKFTGNQYPIPTIKAKIHAGRDRLIWSQANSVLEFQRSEQLASHTSRMTMIHGGFKMRVTTSPLYSSVLTVVSLSLNVTDLLYQKFFTLLRCVRCATRQETRLQTQLQLLHEYLLGDVSFWYLLPFHGHNGAAARTFRASVQRLGLQL